MTLSYASSNQLDLTYLLNFNDFIGSFTVMSTLLVGNNWNDTVDTWSDIVGTEFWPKVYFSMFLFAS